MLNYNPILDTDSYKMSHFLGYPKGTTEMYSYLESRGGRYPNTVFFGLQPILQNLLYPITKEMIEEAEEFAAAQGEPFNREGWYDILNRYGGHLPLEIKAVDEGSVIPYQNVLMTVRNTDEKHPWLTSYFETALLRVWYPITVATRIANMKKSIIPFFNKTSDNLNSLPFSLLDFSSRGVSSYGQSEVGGAAYLASFLGSDNVPAVRFVNNHYSSNMSGFSVPATEHSIMCSYKDLSNQYGCLENLIDNMGQPGGILSVVGDTWDIYQFTRDAASLEKKIQEKKLTFVIRPDSGDIGEVLWKVLYLLREARVSSHENSKGYQVMDNFKVLWGDGIDEDTVTDPFRLAMYEDFSADNIITGSGGGLMQVDINRDTNKFAVKGSNVIIDGESLPIAKDPITDPGKKSKKGKMILVRTPDIGFTKGSIQTLTTEQPEAYELLSDRDLLKTRFYNGEMKNYTNIDEVRNTLDSQLHLL